MVQLVLVVHHSFLSVSLTSYKGGHFNFTFTLTFMGLRIKMSLDTSLTKSLNLTMMDK